MDKEKPLKNLNLPPMRAQDFSEIEDWPGYFESVKGKGARETLLVALESFYKEGVEKGFAVDLAAGEGRDTIELLRRGWKVIATDNHPEAFNHMMSQVPQESLPNLTAEVVSFSEIQISKCDLLNASFALPFCEPKHFSDLWNKIVNAVVVNGRFAGQFFGDRDDWASIPGRAHHSEEDVLNLLKGFDIEMMRVEERDDSPDIRNPKHWHMFHVVAKKKF